jgi:hypothetical protein
MARSAGKVCGYGELALERHRVSRAICTESTAQRALVLMSAMAEFQPVASTQNQKWEAVLPPKLGSLKHATY